MRLRSGILGLTLTSVLALASANAADVYVPQAPGGYKDVYVPVLTWTGFYLGGHMGAAWSTLDLNRWDWKDQAGKDWTIGGGSLNSSGAFGGGQLGYNFQSANFVYGIEADLGALAADDRRHFWVNGVSLDPKISSGFYGDITGRLGWTWGTALLYAKGGFAWLDTDLSMHEQWHGVWFNHDNNNTLTGWTLGGGIEYKVAPNWSFKVEYLHFDFSNNDNTNWCLSPGCPGQWRNNHDLTVDTVKLGVNYFFTYAPAPIPLK